MSMVGFDIDPETENAIRALHVSLGLPVSLRAVRVALLRVGLSADPTAVREAALSAHRPPGRVPRASVPGNGTDPANAKIAPVRKNAAWQALDRRNAKLQQQKK